MKQQRVPRHRISAWSGVAAVTVTAALLVAGCGGSDSGSADAGGGLTSDNADDAGTAGDPRTVEITMLDNEYSPDRVEVAPGETVRFVLTNEGNAVHDAFVGDEAAQAEHEDEMRAAEEAGSGGTDGGMSHGPEADGDDAAITVEPGMSGELTYTFDAGDELLIGCHEPGHYDAGMTLAIGLASG